MKKTMLMLMFLTLVSKVIGFVRDVVLSYFYGASYISDAYFISQTIPTVIFSMVGMGIATGYIPMFNKIEKEEGKVLANRYTNNVANLVILICTLISIIVILFTENVVLIFASGFEGQVLELAIVFTRISIIGIYFSALVYVFQSFLQIKDNYSVPALVGLPLNLVIIISIIISSKGNIYVLAIGSVIALAVQLLILLIYSLKKGYKYEAALDIKDKYLQKMMVLAIPVILGTSTTQINKIVDRTLASQIAEGGISALSYAHKLDGFIKSIFIVSIVTVLYPNISKMASSNNIEGLKKSMNRAMLGIIVLIIPATIGAMVFSEQIVVLLFGRGAFDKEAIAMTANALFFYSIGMIGVGIRTTLTKGFYSLQDTKTPMINSSLAMIANIILNIILSKYLGIGGLALATSIAAIMSMALMLISLRKKIGPLGMKQISISFLKILFASLVMGLLAKLSFNYLTSFLSQNLSLMLAIGVGALSYFVIIYFMKIEDVDVIVGAVKKKLGKGISKAK